MGHKYWHPALKRNQVIQVGDTEGLHVNPIRGDVLIEFEQWWAWSRLPDEPVDAREAVAVAARALVRAVEHAVAVAAQVFLRRKFITDALRKAGRVLVLSRRAGHERSQSHSVQLGGINVLY